METSDVPIQCGRCSQLSNIILHVMRVHVMGPLHSILLYANVQTTKLDLTLVFCFPRFPHSSSIHCSSSSSSSSSVLHLLITFLFYLF